MVWLTPHRRVTLPPNSFCRFFLQQRRPQSQLCPFVKTKSSNSWFLWPHVFQFLLRCYNRKFFRSPGVTHTFSLSLFQIVLFFFSHPNPPFICLSPLFYNDILCSYLYNYLVATQILRDIFLYIIGFLPTFLLEFWLLGVVCTVQAVSYAFNAAEVR